MSQGDRWSYVDDNLGDEKTMEFRIITNPERIWGEGDRTWLLSSGLGQKMERKWVIKSQALTNEWQVVETGMQLGKATNLSWEEKEYFYLVIATF